MLRIIGGLLILMGVVDLIGSYTDFDLWGEWIGVELPEVIWRYSAWIEIGIGWLLIQFGGGGSGNDESDDSGSDEAQR